MSGYTLVHHTADALLAFMKRTAEHREFTAVFDPSPMIATVDDDVFVRCSHIVRYGRAMNAKQR